MTNKEVFERYGNIQWVVEENMYFLLQQFSEKLGVRPSFNTVGFIKSFMKEETLTDVKWAEQARQERLEQMSSEINKGDYIDGDFRELP